MRALRPLTLAALALAAAGPSVGQVAPPGTGAGVAAAPPEAVTATPAPAAVLTLDQEALYRESRWGRRAQADLEARSREMAAENDRIAARLEAEDDALTALRASLPEDEFRRRADAFDAKVQQVRQDRDQAGRDLLATADADRTTFLNAALPELTALMRERGAVALLDRRTVFLSIEQIDVTAAMIARADAALGDGAGAGAAEEGAGAGAAEEGAGAGAAEEGAGAGAAEEGAGAEGRAGEGGASAAATVRAGAGVAGDADGSTAGAAGAPVDAPGANGANPGAAIDPGAGAADVPAGSGAESPPETGGSNDHAATLGGRAGGGLAGPDSIGNVPPQTPAPSSSIWPQPSGIAPAGPAPQQPPAPPTSGAPSR